MALDGAVSLIGQLLPDHYQELATNKAMRELAPDWDKYVALQSAGILDIIVIFVDEDAVGYTANIRQPHIHYKHLTVSNNDVIYLSPAHRGAGVGGALMDATEELALARGAQEVLWHAKPGTALDSLLQAREAPIQDIIYSRALRSVDGVLSPSHTGGGSGQLRPAEGRE